MAQVWLIQKKTWQLPVVCVAIAIAIILLFYKSFEYGLKNLSPIPIRTADISPNDNWIVIYQLDHDELILLLVATGSHEILNQ